jgi:hypothetical protein
MDNDYDDEYDLNDSRSRTRIRKRMAPAGVHVPNKNEASLLRKLMSDSGLSEKEVRAHKKYRVMLSDAQNKGIKPTKSKMEKAQERIMKGVTKDLKLAKEHPLVIKEYRIRFDKWYDRYGWKLR